MKRFLTIAFLGLAVLGLAACGGSDNPPEKKSEEMENEEKMKVVECKGTGVAAMDGKCNSTVDTKTDQENFVSARSLRFRIGDLNDLTSISKNALLTRGDQNDDPKGPDGGTADEGFKTADDNNKVRKTLTAEGKEIGERVTITAADASKVAAGVLSDGPQKVHAPNGVYDADNNKDTAVVAAFFMPATFDGVAGTIFCTGSCTSKANADGTIALGGTWGFAATDPKAKRSPAAYAEYGWWRHNWDSGDVRDIGVFYGAVATGPEHTAPTSLDFGGTATYEGMAAGLYAINVGAGEANDAGHFEAKAVLTAVFGDDASLSGTVDNFKGADGQDRDWKIELVKADLSSTGAVMPSSEVKWTVNGETDDDGRWRAQMRGENDKYPGYALGAFHAEHDETDGRIIGAFGTEHKKE